MPSVLGLAVAFLRLSVPSYIQTTNHPLPAPTHPQNVHSPTSTTQSTSRLPTPEIHPATPPDIPALKRIITTAYTKYIPRIGRDPAPMLMDYPGLLSIPTQQVYVLKTDSEVLGSIMLSTDCDSALKINNLVVDPSAQEHGYGRQPINYAECLARARGWDAITLYTNVKMWENVALYAKLEFIEVRRGVEDGFERVYFRKVLGGEVE